MGCGCGGNRQLSRPGTIKAPVGANRPVSPSTTVIRSGPAPSIRVIRRTV